jgi:hypothetical protein
VNAPKTIASTTISDTAIFTEMKSLSHLNIKPHLSPKINFTPKNHFIE